MFAVKTFALALLVSLVSAQAGTVVPEYGQCGGVNWAGGTICPKGFYCYPHNIYIFQCIPGTSSTSSIRTTTTSSTTKTPPSPPPKPTSKFTTTRKSVKTTSKTTSPSRTTTKLTTTPLITTKPTTTASPTPSPIPNVAEWGQCGGQGFTGGHICPYAFRCVKANDFFSQCLPDPSVSTTTRTTASRTTTSERPYVTPLRNIFVFGDSYSQSGFDLSGTKPSNNNRLGNPPYPGWTTSGRENWATYLVENNYFLLEYNLASGGATTDSALVTPFAPTVLSFVDQVSLFISNFSPPPDYAPWTLNDTVAAIWIGVNDVGNAWYKPEWPTLSQQIVDRYFSQVEILYGAGIRKFAILTVPPINRTPAMLQQSESVRSAQGVAIAQFNSLLLAGKNSFVAAHPGVSVVYEDTAVIFNFALDNPQFYGVADNSCYNADGLTCFWWNDYHPGIIIQRALGQDVAYYLGIS